MSTKTNDGGPAFPHAHEDYPFQHGMSLRDYAIVQFMAALIAKDEFNWESGKLQSSNGACAPIIIAEEQADAMLAAREKGRK